MRKGTGGSSTTVVYQNSSARQSALTAVSRTPNKDQRFQGEMTTSMRTTSRMRG